MGTFGLGLSPEISNLGQKEELKEKKAELIHPGESILVGPPTSCYNLDPWSSIGVIVLLHLGPQLYLFT